MPFENRSRERDVCELPASVEVGGKSVSCVVENVSEGGARLRIDPALELPEHFALSLPVIEDAVDRRRVELRWRIGSVAGVRFVGRW